MKLYDAISISDRIKSRLLTKLGGKNMLLFSTNAATIEAVGEEFADLVSYDENLTREVIWTHARNASSVFGQVDFFNYKPHRMIGAKGPLKVSASSNLNGGHPYNININKWDEFSGDGISFVATETYRMGANTNFLMVTIAQGKARTYEVEITEPMFPAPKGTDYATLELFNPKVENTYYDLYVNGELWSEVDHIRLAQSPESKVYVLKTITDYQGVEISFGNGVFGKRIKYGDIITFKYLETEGAFGNVLSSGIINKVVSEIRNELGQVVQLYCSNESPLAGGKSYEDIESIKANAPKSYQTGERAISTSDYVSLILRSGQAERVMVWGEKEINEDLGNKPGTYIPSTENLIYLSGFNLSPITRLGIILSEGQKEAIRQNLNEKKGPTDILQFVNAEFIYISFHVRAFISDRRYSAEQVRANIHSKLFREYSLDNNDFRKNLYFSDYYRAVDEVEGVDHHRTYLTFSEVFSFKSAYEFYAHLNLAQIKENSVSVLVRNIAAGMDWTTIATDDGSGNLVGLPVDPDAPDLEYYQLPGATISYADGLIGDVIITSGLPNLPYGNFEIRIDFSLEDTQEGNLVLTKRNQIYSFYESDITTEFMIGV